MKKILLLTFFFNVFFFSHAQQNPLWTKLNGDRTATTEKFERKSTPKEFQIYALNFDLLKSKLAAAPSKEDNKSKAGVIIPFPNAKGILENFKVYNASIMAPELAARYQDIQSYVGVGIDNPLMTIRFSVTLFGLHTMTFTNDGETRYIDTYTKDLKKYIVYDRSQLESTEGFSCQVRDSEDTSTSERNPNATQSNTGIKRVYRLAIATTVEYSNFHINAAGLSNGTTDQKKAAVLAAITVTMTRVNGVYERDLSVTMQLVANESNLISIGTDNLSNDSTGALIGESQTFIDGTIGNGSYDIGHTFSTGAGGLAQLACVCVSTRKAMGITGIQAPVNDAYDIDYVAHEMGHQFGANHTFNGVQGSCGGGNRNAGTAVEPGSGTTIMAYAGICGSDNVQIHSDAHFHAVSLGEMNNHIAGAGNCSVNTPTSNPAPLISVTNYTIPKSTPFILKGSATDAGNENLTYCWEQTNLGSNTNAPVATNTTGPNFRSRTPLASPERFMPPLSNVVANNLAPAYEVVPSVARVLNFALTVRDNDVLNGSQTNRADITVTVANVGPFLVSSPNTNVSWTVGSNQTITWDVAGTDANNINSHFVDIYLSTNSGVNFNTLLASNVPNDGSEIITVPNNIGSTNRIMVRSHDNIFYDVSNANFAITAAPTPTFAIAYNGVAGGQNVTGCLSSPTAYTLKYSTVGAFTDATTFTATGNPDGSTVTFSPQSATSTGIVTVTVSNVTTEGFYPITVTATSGATTKTVNLYLEVIDAFFLPITLSSPANGVDQQPTTVELTWVADPVFASSYDVQIATDLAFTNIQDAATVTENAYTAFILNNNTAYYWRVAPRLGGCTGDFSTPYQFTTGTLGIDSNTAFNFSVYPNPNNGSFTIQSDKFSSDKIKVQVYDMRGRMIYNKEYNGSNSFNENIRMNNAEAGVYLLSVSDGMNKDVKRIIIK